MSKPYSFTITGRPDDGFTSAEISANGGEQEIVGRVFELGSSWYVELDEPEKLRNTALVEAVVEAKNELLHYVNRKGGEFPDDATPVGISLWLMQRDDGTGLTIE